MEQPIEKKNSKIYWLTLGSLLSGALSLFWAIFGFIAIILGAISLRKIKKQGGEQYKQLAVLGIILGVIGVGYFSYRVYSVFDIFHGSGSQEIEVTKDSVREYFLYDDFDCNTGLALTDGVYESSDYQCYGRTYDSVTIQIYNDKIAVGDLNNDGRDDVAVIVSKDYGGGRSIIHELSVSINKTVLGAKEKMLVPKAREILIGSLAIEDIRIEQGAVLIDLGDEGILQYTYVEDGQFLQRIGSSPETSENLYWEDYMELAREEGDESYCSNIEDNIHRSNCYYALAYQLSDPEICGEISDLTTKDECYSRLALMLKEQAVCDNAEDPSIKCKKYFEVINSDSSGWSVYSNEKNSFEFKIAPIFNELGYEIIEATSPAVFLGGECDVVSFKTHPVEPYYGNFGQDRLGVFMPLYICPIEYCQENDDTRQFCDALREGRRETEDGDWIFSDYVTENESVIVYEEGAPSSGDVYDAFGWDKGDVLGAKDKMLSTFEFLE